MRRTAIAILCMGVALTIAGCDFDRLYDVVGEESTWRPRAMPLGEQIVMEVSEIAGPASGREDEESDILYVTYDLSDVPMVAEGRFDDLILATDTPHLCEEEVEVLEPRTGSWERLSYEEGWYWGGCGCITSVYAHLLSSRGLSARKCVSDSLTLKVRSRWGWPRELCALVMNPRYESISLAIPFHYTREWIPDDTFGTWCTRTCAGIADDGRSIWTWSREAKKLYRLDFDGRVIGEFDGPETDITDVSYDGEHIWLVGASHMLYRLDQSGMVIDTCAAPGGLPVRHMAWGEGKLWVASEAGWPWRRIFGVEIAAPGNVTDAVVTDSLSVHRSLAGLAVGNGRLYVSVDSGPPRLLEVSFDGELLATHSLTIGSPGDVCWAGGALWMVYESLNGLPEVVSGLAVTHDPVASRFLLPPAEPR